MALLKFNHDTNIKINKFTCILCRFDKRVNRVFPHNNCLCVIIRRHLHSNQSKMNKPIIIPCILCTNQADIDKANELGFKPPKESHEIHPTTFFKIDAVEDPFFIDEQAEIQEKCYVYLAGRIFASVLSKEDIIFKMRKEGWI